LIYTPGTPLRLTAANHISDSAKRRLITVAKSGEISFDGHSYGLGTLESLRTALNRFPAGSPLYWAAEPGAPKQILTSIVQIAAESGLNLQTGGPIQLPAGSHGIGVPGPTKIVAIDLAGQFYFENQIIQEQPLKLRLAESVRKSPGLTLVILADRDVPDGTITRLEQLAQESGIESVVKATRPRLLGRDTGNPSAEP